MLWLLRDRGRSSLESRRTHRGSRASGCRRRLKLVSLAANQRWDWSRRAWGRERRNNRVDYSSPVAENEFRHNDCAGNISHARGRRRKVNGEGSRAVRIDRVRAFLLGVESSYGIGWKRKSWRRYCIRARQNQVHLREVACPIEMGHGDSLALNYRPVGNKNLAGDRKRVIAGQCGVSTTIIVGALSMCWCRKTHPKKSEPDCDL